MIFIISNWVANQLLFIRSTGKEGFVKGFNSPPYLKPKTLEDEINELKHRQDVEFKIVEHRTGRSVW